MEFDYLKREWSRGYVHVPVLPISINGFPIGHALVDTGADVTILPMEVNDVLNMELNWDKAIKLVGAGGDQFQAVPTAKKLMYCIEHAGFRPITWAGTAFFSVEQPTILLGQYQCLSELKLTLDAPRRKIRVEQ